MSGISYNVWLRGMCAGVSWFHLLCFPAETCRNQYIEQRSGKISAYRSSFLLQIVPMFNFKYIIGVIRINQGPRGGAVVEALRYKPEGRGIDSRWYHWKFLLR
jgi:hypothetical protein